jgi:hypothetical protein
MQANKGKQKASDGLISVINYKWLRDYNLSDLPLFLNYNKL